MPTISAGGDGGRSAAEPVGRFADMLLPDAPDLYESFTGLCDGPICEHPTHAHIRSRAYVRALEHAPASRAYV